MGYRLTIHQNKNVQSTCWSMSQQYSQAVINNIIDPAGGNISKLLTAIPSPFARMHMFETAFEMCIKNNGKARNDVFDKLVSECFDMFELFYNINLHKNAGNEITIKTWDYARHTGRLCASKDIAHNQLGNVLRKYIVNNANLNSNPNIYLFYINGRVFGGTSPFTGFFTKPNIKKFEVKRADGNPYFSVATPIWERNPEFILALYKTFSLQNGSLARTASSVFSYLTNNSIIEKITDINLKLQVNNIVNNTPDASIPTFGTLLDDTGAILTICRSNIFVQNNVAPSMNQSPLMLKTPANWQKPAYLSNIPLVLRDGEDHLGSKNSNIKVPHNAGPINQINNRLLPGNGIKYPYLVVDDFLEDYLIELRYPINDCNFIIPNFIGIDKEKDNGFLLPIKKEYFDYFDEDTLQKNISIRNLGNGYQVELIVPIQGNAPVIFKKLYYADSIAGNTGKLIANSNIYMAFFPLFKVVDGGEVFNDFYKIMLVDDEPAKAFVELNIFDENNTQIALNAGAQKTISNSIRIPKTPDNFGGSIYYNVNFPYRYIEVNIPENDISNNKMKGLIIPKWREVPIGNKSYDIAVDFGTTNTNVSLREYRGTQNTKLETFRIGQNDQQTVLLNKPNHNPNYTLTEQYEKSNSFVDRRLIDRIIHEFVPSIIGEEIERPKYGFPMRTAVAMPKRNRIGSLKLFENVNISFAYEKVPLWPDEEIKTNLKWDISDAQTSSMITQFINELLYLIRNKVILNGGDPRLCNLIWFKPLSMYLNDQVIFGQIWTNSLGEIFKIKNSSEHIVPLTESCAPYFYYADMNRANSKYPVLSLDIGGGSTDVSFFINSEPVFGTSFNFAGNSMWNPGIVKKQRQIVGLVNYYGQSFFENFVKKSSAFQRLLAGEIFAGGLHSEDMFNLYFTWDHILGIRQELSRDPKVKFLILFHFSSIIYHCTKLLYEKGLPKPQMVCLSGNGSNYLSIIDPSKTLKLINGFLDQFVSEIVQDGSKYKVTLEQVVNKKEATSIGGLFLLADSRVQNTPLKDTQETVPYYGEETPKFQSLFYSEINDSIKKSVVENVDKFLDVFFAMDKLYPFQANLGIHLPKEYEYYKEKIKANTIQYLEDGLANRMKTAKSSDHVNEPLFFYPLISMIFELGKLFYDGEDDEN